MWPRTRPVRTASVANLPACAKFVPVIRAAWNTTLQTAAALSSIGHTLLATVRALRARKAASSPRHAWTATPPPRSTAVSQALKYVQQALGGSLEKAASTCRSA
jgi:hypothetical protein